MILSLFLLLAFSSINKDQAIADKIKQERLLHDKKDQEVRKSLAALYKVQKKLKDLNREVSGLEKEKEKNLIKVKEISKEMKRISKEIREIQNILQMRMRLASNILDNSLQEIIVFSKSPNEIERTLKGLESIMEKDISLLQGVEKKKVKYEKGRQKLKNDVLKYRDNKEQLAASMRDLLRYKKEKENLVGKLKKDRKKHELALKVLREKGESLLLLSEDLNKKIAKEIFNKSFFEYKGQLVKPINGNLIEPYGSGKHSDGRFFSKGIWIEGSYLKEVIAVASGRVAFIGKINPISKFLVVDHGSHYYSVYGPIVNSPLKIGDEIGFKQAIGQLGQNLIHKQSALYFEIRHYSEPVNPANWFATSEQSISKMDKKGEKREVY